ncbi:hypothetical protein ACFWZ4_00490 [Frateuria sp. GZRe12]|uniref:hypothetical protein n=1 Tax=Frateuria sp. GZRe12 TaxID=3351533 RepID=UPI003EDCAD4E
MDENLPRPTGESLLYQSEDGRRRIECRFEDRTLWLSQTQLAAFEQDIQHLPAKPPRTKKKS